MRLLNPRLHGYLDILFTVCFVVGPLALGLGGAPALISLLLALAFLILNLATRAPIGVGRSITAVIHGLFELATIVFLAVLPRLGGYTPGSAARSFFWTMSTAIALVWLLTDYRGQERTAGEAA